MHYGHSLPAELANKRISEVFPWVKQNDGEDLPLYHFFTHRYKSYERGLWAQVLSGTDKQIIGFIKNLIRYHPVNYGVPENMVDSVLNSFAATILYNATGFEDAINGKGVDGREFYSTWLVGYKAGLQEKDK